MKTFTIGDIHGAYLALLQCLERSKFDYDKDHLIVLGDVCDGWPFVKDCFDELLKIKNLTYLIGNHDEWTRTFYQEFNKYGLAQAKPLWTKQGGLMTLASYQNEKMPDAHLNLLNNALYYFEDEYNGRVFAHAGLDPNQRVMDRQEKDLLVWDRQLLKSAWQKRFSNPDYKFGGWNEIFVGHTTTQWFKSGHVEPLHLCNVWALDTGAGWNGKLTIMNVDNKVYWQSDFTHILYPDIKGRE